MNPFILWTLISGGVALLIHHAKKAAAVTPSSSAALPVTGASGQPPILRSPVRPAISPEQNFSAAPVPGWVPVYQTNYGYFGGMSASPSTGKILGYVNPAILPQDVTNEPVVTLDPFTAIQNVKGMWIEVAVARPMM